MTTTTLIKHEFKDGVVTARLCLALNHADTNTFSWLDSTALTIAFKDTENKDIFGNQFTGKELCAISSIFYIEREIRTLLAQLPSVSIQMDNRIISFTHQGCMGEWPINFTLRPLTCIDPAQ